MDGGSREVPETWGGGDSRKYMGVTLAETPSNGGYGA
uniref:Uncharacterized protein n=1 Tax=Trichinella nativa TaxID=6335 RepID=A0A0V1KJ23_9BILA